MTKDEVALVVGKLRALAEDCRETDGWEDATETCDEAAALIERQAAEVAAAVAECSKWARLAGEAEGKLKASEMAGVVEGWQERCFKAEAQLAEAQSECLEQARLVGMGAEREARLMAQLAAARAEVTRLTPPPPGEEQPAAAERDDAGEQS